MLDGIDDASGTYWWAKGTQSCSQTARLRYATRECLAQVMKRRLLAADVQAMVLHMRLVAEGRNPVTKRELRPVVAGRCWNAQREMCERGAPLGLNSVVVISPAASPQPPAR